MPRLAGAVWVFDDATPSLKRGVYVTQAGAVTPAYRDDADYFARQLDIRELDRLPKWAICALGLEPRMWVEDGL